ncbi:MAG: hypothetical protein AAFY57_18445, partial [Cyanobacteria bacterium J06642_2]
ESIYQATAIACDGKSGDWQDHELVTARLGKCDRVSGLGDLLFDVKDCAYYLITGHQLLPMFKVGECLCFQ